MEALENVSAEAGGVGGIVDGEDVALQAVGPPGGSGTRCQSPPLPTLSDRLPMLAKPWLSRSTIVTLTPSWTMVAISLFIIRYDPSPTIT